MALPDRDLRSSDASGSTPPSFADRQREAAEYVADLTGELSVLARETRLDVLAYLLDVARLEARTKAREIGRQADVTASDT